MSLEQFVSELDERRAADAAEHAIREVGHMADAIMQLYMVRNDRTITDPAIVAQRQAIMDLAIKIVKGKMKRYVKSVLLPALKQWEMYDG